MNTSKVRNRFSVSAAMTAAVLGLSGTVHADTRHVPAQYPNIQAAINAAVNGDTVLVADGYYTGVGNRDISFLGKAITVRSANGAANCTVDAQALPAQQRGVFQFNNGETAAAVFEGFTIRGGYLFNGGGVMISSASPTVRNCVMTANMCDCWGAAVYVEGPGNAVIENCRLVGNTSAAEGGGAFIWNSSPIFRNCEISGNSGDFGVGVCAISGGGQLVNCVIAENGPGYGAGGVYMSHGTMTNCTIVGNETTSYASALYLQGSAAVRNTIIWGNTGPTTIIAPQGTVTYSNVQDSFAGTGNISADPKFATALLGNYSLTDGSACIDAGNSMAAGLPATDMVGAARRIDDPQTVDTGIGGTPVVDMGAYEFAPAPCACDIDGGGLAVSDIFAFLGLWFAHAPQADFDANSQIQTADIFSYLSCWFGSCN